MVEVSYFKRLALTSFILSFKDLTNKLPFSNNCQESTNSLSSVAIRPAFYVQDIKLLSGNGTKQNPYIIE